MLVDTSALVVVRVGWLPYLARSFVIFPLSSQGFIKAAIFSKGKPLFISSQKAEQKFGK